MPATCSRANIEINISMNQEKKSIQFKYPAHADLLEISKITVRISGNLMSIDNVLNWSKKIMKHPVSNTNFGHSSHIILSQKLPINAP